MIPDLIALAVPAALALVDEPPRPEEVKAGWTAFAVFLLLCVATALLCWSFVRQLRKAQRARDAGVFGDQRQADRPTGDSGHPGGSGKPGTSGDSGDSGAGAPGD